MAKLECDSGSWNVLGELLDMVVRACVSIIACLGVFLLSFNLFGRVFVRGRVVFWCGWFGGAM